VSRASEEALAGLAGQLHAGVARALQQLLAALVADGGTASEVSERLGLAVATLDLPDRNYQAALEAVTPAANDAKADEAVSSSPPGRRQQGPVAIAQTFLAAPVRGEGKRTRRTVQTAQSGQPCRVRERWWEG